MHKDLETILACHKAASSTSVNQSHYSLYTTCVYMCIYMYIHVTNEMQALHGASCPCLGSLGGHISLSPIQSGKGHPKEHLWVLCNLLTEPLVSLAVGTSHTWYCFSGLSCLHNSRSRALGCLSILFLSTPAASKLANICICVTQMRSLPAWPPLGSSHF